MLCSKFANRRNTLPPIPTISKNDMSSKHPSNPPTNRQRQDFWTTVLDEPQRQREHQTDSESSGLRPSRRQTKMTDDHRSAHSSHSSSQSSQRKETPCPRCGALFKRKYDLHQHISAVHEKNRPFKCDTCDSTFAHKGTLSKHVRTVHKRERPYGCEHCGARFSERGNVNKHKQRSQACKIAEERANKNRASHSGHSSHSGQKSK